MDKLIVFGLLICLLIAGPAAAGAVNEIIHDWTIGIGNHGIGFMGYGWGSSIHYGSGSVYIPINLYALTALFGEVIYFLIAGYFMRRNHK
ncbi:hypothetical protein ACFL4W_02960, partial [Planctomycetota bacterium]